MVADLVLADVGQGYVYRPANAIEPALTLNYYRVPLKGSIKGYYEGSIYTGYIVGLLVRNIPCKFRTTP